MEDHGKIWEDQVYTSSLKIGVACHGAAHSGYPTVTMLIIIKRFVIRIEACSFIPIF